MQEEEDEDDIYAPDDSIPGLSTPAPISGGAIPPKANDDLEEGEEEDEEMEEDYGESDSVSFWTFFLFLFFFSVCFICKTLLEQLNSFSSQEFI